MNAPMRITVDGCRLRYDRPFWTEIEHTIGLLLAEPDGHLTRIARPDGQANYRAFGVYTLTYETPNGDYPVTLELR